MRFVVVTGMSGGGKRTALKLLEDAGFYCVDNLPVSLVEKFVELIAMPGSEISKVALGLDVRADQNFTDATRILEQLKEKGYSCSLVNARFVKPFDEELLLKLQKNHKLLVTLEENVQSGGFGEHVLEFMNTNGDGSMEVLNIAIPDVYVEHGNVELLRKETGIDADGIIGKIIDRKAQ